MNVASEMTGGLAGARNRNENVPERNTIMHFPSALAVEQAVSDRKFAVNKRAKVVKLRREWCVVELNIMIEWK